METEGSKRLQKLQEFLISYAKTTIQQEKASVHPLKMKRQQGKGHMKRETKEGRRRRVMLLPDAASVEERRSTAATSANDDASIAVAEPTGDLAEAEAELETDTSFGLRLELQPHRTGGEREVERRKDESWWRAPFRS